MEKFPPWLLDIFMAMGVMTTGLTVIVIVALAYSNIYDWWTRSNYYKIKYQEECDTNDNLRRLILELRQRLAKYEETDDEDD